MDVFWEYKMPDNLEPESGQLKIKFVDAFARLDGKLDHVVETTKRIEKNQHSQDERIRKLEDVKIAHEVKLEQGGKTFGELRQGQRELAEKVAAKMSSGEFESRFKTQLYKAIGVTVVGGGAAAAALFKIFG